MMNKAFKIFLLLCLVLTASCETDLEVAPYKDMTIIYGLINIKDTAQYLRINRGFLSTDDPYNYTQVNDSVNYPDDAFEVFLERYVNGIATGDTIEYEPVDRQKEPGLFSNESNCVYRTEEEIHAESQYLLYVTERSTGREITGWATVLGGITMEESFYQERSFYRVDYRAEHMYDYEGSLDPNDHDHYIMRFLYWEYADGETYHKYVDWVPSMDPFGYKSKDSLQLFDQYYEYLATQIPVDPGVRRRARGVDYMLALPGKELQSFIEVYEQPTNPHFFPDYSNVENGHGIFACKYGYTYFGLRLKKRTVDTISWGRHLYHHRFADSNGEWH